MSGETTMWGARTGIGTRRRSWEPLGYEVMQKAGVYYPASSSHRLEEAPVCYSLHNNLPMLSYGCFPTMLYHCQCEPLVDRGGFDNFRKQTPEGECSKWQERRLNKASGFTSCSAPTISSGQSSQGKGHPSTCQPD